MGAGVGLDGGQRLAELYNSEMVAWKDECLANVETPEDRKQKCVVVLVPPNDDVDCIMNCSELEGMFTYVCVYVRVKRMIQRALELKERREQERRAIVEEKRMQQYRCVCPARRRVRPRACERL